MAYTNAQKNIPYRNQQTPYVPYSKKQTFTKKRQFKLLTLNDKRKSLQTTVLQAPDFGQAHAYDC